MLDQSFSAHNLEVIFDLENRKGNIDINWMPEEYRAAATEMKELRRQISELKSKGLFFEKVRLVLGTFE